MNSLIIFASFACVCSVVFALPAADGYGKNSYHDDEHEHHGQHDQHGHHGGHGKDHYAKPKYSYGYGVDDKYHGTNFGHSESRDGHITKGEYYVHLPDGRLQTVSYYVDKWGYHPTITYSGKAKYPSHSNGQHKKSGYGTHNDGYKSQDNGYKSHDNGYESHNDRHDTHYGKNVDGHY